MTNSKFRSLILLMLAFLAFVGCRKTLDNFPPTVSFVAPQNNAFFDGDSTILFILDPQDEDGSISKVELLEDGKLLHVLAGQPWQVELPTASIGPGARSITAIAYDDEDETGSAVLNISVGDERDSLVGDYVGFRVETIVQNGVYYRDTIQITATLTKSSTRDSVVDIHFQTTLSYTPYAFSVANGTFEPACCAPHPPTMTITNGHMEINHRPGQGPRWFDYTADKVQ